MAEISEKQQLPDAAVYPANQANQGYPAGAMAPNVVHVVSQPQTAAVTGQQYRDQCKFLPFY